MRRFLACAALLLIAAAPPLPSSPDTWVAQASAEISVLDKVNAQSSTLSIRAGQSAEFGSLTISVQRCVARPPDVSQDWAAFVDITDSHKTAPEFRGWMLANEPALGLYEHPLYDVRMLGCR